MMKWPYENIGVLTTRAFRNLLNKIFGDIGADMQEQKDRVDNLINGVEQPSEVVDMHLGRDSQTYPVARDMVLGEIGKTEAAQDLINADHAAQLANMETQANHQADKDYLENMIQTAFSGMGEPYDTLANLQSAYPSGDSKPHVVTADGNWYFWSSVASAWTSGGVFQATQISDGSITDTKMGISYLIGSVISGGIDIDTATRSITVRQGTIIATSRGHVNISTTSLSYAGSANPDNDKYIYCDIVAGTVNWDENFGNFINDKNNALLGILYGDKITSQNLDMWTVNSQQYGNRLITNDSLLFRGNGYIGYSTPNGIELDTVSKKFRVTVAMNIIYHNNEALNIAVQDWDYIASSDSSVVQTVFVDLIDNKVKVAANGVPIQSPYVILFRFCGSANVINQSIWGNDDVLHGLVINGNKLSTRYSAHLGQLGYSADGSIQLDTINKKIKLNSSIYVLYADKSISITAYDWIDWDSGATTDLILTCYLDMDDNRIHVANYDTIPDREYDIVFLFRFQGSYFEYKEFYGSHPFTIISDDKNIKFDFADSYRWDQNRFIIPKNLYLIKDIEYGINPQNFNALDYLDMDSLLFELPMPTRTEQFAKYGKISSPVSGEFLTKVVGKYKNDDFNSLSKDIKLHVKDLSDIVSNTVKVLYVGDSIVYGNLPQTLKYWLSKFGITATMIGTLDELMYFGYGIQPALTSEKGEGRSGWRLTDFAETTQYPEGSTQTLTSPFWNPNTSQLDFQYYLNQNSLQVPDIVIIALGTNDITGFHNYNGIPETMDDQLNTIIQRDLTALINMFKAVNPDIKIGINPPMTNGLDANFATNAKLWAEKEQYLFEENVSFQNVYTLSSYLSSARLAVPSYVWANYPDPTAISSINNTMKGQFIDNVHQNGMGQLQNALWVASWIINLL